MGAKQSKRSVDISGKEADGAGEVAVAGAGGEGRMEALADADALKPQLNGDAHIHEENTDKEKQLEIGTPENEKDATTEKENKEQDNEKEKEATPVTNGDPEPKENGETTPAAPEDGKKPKNEKVKKKWSLRSISFSRKDKPKQDKKHKEEQPKTNGEPEKVPEEAADVATPETVKETVEEAKMEIESKDEKTPETPVTEPLTNGTSTPETPKVESPAAEEPLPTPAKEEAKPEVKAETEPEQLPVNGLSLEEPKSEIPEISHTEESKPAETIQSTETAPVPESPFNKEVCVVALSVDTPPPPLPANPPPSAVASFAVTTMALDVDASLFNTAESPSTIALATGDQIEPQTCALAYSTENTQPISPLKVLSYEEDENKSTAKDLDESALISSSQIDTKPVESNLNVDKIQESVKTSEIVVDNTETVLESESEAKVVLEESAIVEPHLVTEVVLEKETVTNKSENEFQQEKLNNTDVSQNNTTIDIVAEPTETTNLKTSIENSRDVINETVAEPIADILKQSDNRSQSDIVSEVLSEEIVSEVDNSASFVAVNKEVVEQNTDEMLDKSEEDNKNSCRSIAESIIDRVAEEVANITVDDVSVKCVTLDNIPLPGHHTDGNELKASEVQSDVDTISEDFIPPLPEPCEIPLPEASLIESLEEAVDDLPPPPPPIEDEMLQAAVENAMKSASSCKNDIIKEASDIKVHINGLEENFTNGNGTIGEENNVKSKDSLGSTKCNGDGKLDTSVEPGHLLQDPLPVSDKIADLIPEVPVVPDLNTDTEISTNVE